MNTKWITNILFFFYMIVLFSCVKNEYKATNRLYKKQARKYSKILSQTNLKDTTDYLKPTNWVGATNFNLRKPNYVIIHHTAQNSCDQTLKTFTTTKTQVSAHYVICKDGTVHHMLNDYLRAWHAGAGRWGNLTDVNSSSIGIELDNNGFEPFAEKQIASLEKLLGQLKKSYAIPAANFIGHADIAPTRKNDPNINFDWKSLSEKGFGIWYSDTTNIEVPTDFKPMIALKMIGYDTKDSTAAVVTFKRKFLKDDKVKTLNNGDLKVLYGVWKEAVK